MFSVSLNIFNGPLDLLLYLVRKREIDIREAPISEIAEQFLAYIETLEALELEEIGEFLVAAATLVEIKSFQALPEEEEASETLADPREDLVQQLLA
ncbi:MAG: segregation/condensation protein A, partial [Thermoguttaceae bacterium]|nr:segregation/condensation protein A [Thermoguttaceae bacterium]